MTTPEPTLAQAEEWARWAAVHDDWDKTRELMGVLLAEYDRRGHAVQIEAGRARRRAEELEPTKVALGEMRQALVALLVAADKGEGLEEARESARTQIYSDLRRLGENAGVALSTCLCGDPRCWDGDPDVV